MDNLELTVLDSKTGILETNISQLELFVNEKLKEIYSHLAGKEMAVGRYYQKSKEYVPALNRFQSVLLDYPNANQSSEALYR